MGNDMREPIYRIHDVTLQQNAFQRRMVTAARLHSLKFTEPLRPHPTHAQHSFPVLVFLVQCWSLNFSHRS